LRTLVFIYEDVFPWYVNRLYKYVNNVIIPYNALSGVLTSPENAWTTTSNGLFSVFRHRKRNGRETKVNQNESAGPVGRTDGRIRTDDRAPTSGCAGIISLRRAGDTGPTVLGMCENPRENLTLSSAFVYIRVNNFFFPSWRPRSNATAYHVPDGSSDFFARTARTTGLVRAAGRPRSDTFRGSPRSLFVESHHVPPRSEFDHRFSHRPHTIPYTVDDMQVRVWLFAGRRCLQSHFGFLGLGGKNIHNTMSNAIVAEWHENQNVHQGKPDEKYQRQCCIRQVGTDRRRDVRCRVQSVRQTDGQIRRFKKSQDGIVSFYFRPCSYVVTFSISVQNNILFDFDW